MLKSILLLIIVTFYLTNSEKLFAKTKLIFGKIEGSNLSEISRQVVEEAYQQLDITVQFSEFPARRSLESSNRGQVDGETHRIKGINKKYTNLLLIPVPINRVEGLVFTKSKEFVVNGWESLRPYRIGIVRGVIFIEKGTEGMNVHSATTNEMVFKILDRGRTDISVVNRVSGLLYLKKLKLKNIKQLEPPVKELELFHYLHKKHRDIVPKISKILSAMQNKGRIKQIREEYIQKILAYK